MERLAFAYMNLDPWVLKAVSILVLLLGSFIYYLSRSSYPSVSRVKYLLTMAILLPLAALEALIWVYTPEAATNRLLPAMIVGEIVLFFILGYVLGMALCGRSNNAYGTAGRWWLGYVPFANLALFYSASREKRQEGRRWLWLSGVGFVILGLVVYGVTGQVQKVVLGIVAKINMQAGVKNPIYTANMIRGGLDVRPLPDALHRIASQVKTPLQIDEATVLVLVVAQGDTLRYDYDVAYEADDLPPAIVNRITTNFCQGAMGPAIEKGATLKAVYRNSAKRLMADLEIDKNACSKLPSI